MDQSIDINNSFVIEGIYTSNRMKEPMVSHESILAVAGAGLEGDRYAIRQGAYSEARTGKPGRIPDDYRQVSIISSYGIKEANDLLEFEGYPPFSAIETRRNLVVNLSPEELNALIGYYFKIGSGYLEEVLMEGVDLCTPCARPANILKRTKEEAKAFESAFQGRGGIRARILTFGMITLGDPITILGRSENIK